MLPNDVSSRLKALPALSAGPVEVVMRHGDGRHESLSPAALGGVLLRGPVIVCNQAVVARRGRVDNPRFLDVLELFAFVRPAAAILPTVRGLAAALGLPDPGHHLAAEADTVALAAHHLLADLLAPRYPYLAAVDQDAADMMTAGWPWAELVLMTLAARSGARPRARPVWEALPEWEDEAPPPPPGTAPVGAEETARRLGDLVGLGSEDRPEQRAYAQTAAEAFAPPAQVRSPRLVLAEAGTGTGKTLGYVAPASLWAEKNRGTVWLSTYTKNLQRQLDQELEKLYPDPQVRAERTVVRKGRENYLCLLNLEERSRQGALNPVARVLIGLVKRWARFSRDGDMVGGDFPSWLASFYGGGRIGGLTDRRGECIYSACAHYRRCFIERAQRKSKTASLVVANHAVVMIQASTGRGPSEVPRRIVFDEGHHLFDAADSAFSVILSGAEAMELRRWIRGTDGTAGRARGLRSRIGDLLSDDESGEKLLADALKAAQGLPADGWLKRIQEGDPYGPTEHFLFHVHAQVHARAGRVEDGHSLETPTNDPVPGLAEAAAHLSAALEDLGKPLSALAIKLTRMLDAEADVLDSTTRGRIESLAKSISHRVETVNYGWRAMLEGLGGAPHDAFVDWFAVDRAQGREMDIGMHRHWIDPTRPFSETVLEGADGVLITSATLRDHDPDAKDPDADWQSAEVRTGGGHLVLPATRASFQSPFDYKTNTRVFIVTDVNRREIDMIAAAYRTLFLAAGGGALGLFTAIARLRAVYDRIEKPLEMAGIPLYAQHVTPMDTASLVDIFRAEQHSCLLGTDAVRDGVDVPGQALRLLVFDRVPWPRPTILHRVRRDAFGGRHYDDMMTRLKLKQAFGRLIRRADDRGVFVMLESAMPSRLLTAFPEGVPVERIGLAETAQKLRAFLGETARP
ncbi:ATP-dependent DNA helicase [Govanella unica]|uniref:ATP-dependent DNA helicase n=1 Tax=Govanella unica TaxID=2975056 RepID=A0A9X3TZF5_9PROT|nr:ATP-dependent DNA helicase [Govania unica]MDA5194608.1 ATP-dependent DNA helicase [Govania unica]